MTSTDPPPRRFADCYVALSDTSRVLRSQGAENETTLAGLLLSSDDIVGVRIFYRADLSGGDRTGATTAPRAGVDV